MLESDHQCPCMSGKSYQECCQPKHARLYPANHPEALMRSRYCAFVLQLWDYLLDTHHPDFRGDLSKQMLADGSDIQWLGLEVLDACNANNTGIVTFKAWFKQAGKVSAIFECSQFLRVNDAWLYTEGEQFNAELPARNDPCVCQSGKKFKKCCGN